MKKVIKRDNRLSEFNADKIRNAIIAAAQYNQIDLLIYIKRKMAEGIKAILNDENKLKEVAKVAFESVDTDKSGQIDQEELTKVMAQISGDIGAEPPSKEEVDEVLKHLDTDKSGKIDFNEFLVLIRDVLKAMVAE